MLACPAGWGSATCVAGGSLFFVGLRPGECSGLLRAARGSRPAGGHFLHWHEESNQRRCLQLNIRYRPLTPYGGPVFLRAKQPLQLRSTRARYPNLPCLAGSGSARRNTSTVTREAVPWSAPRSRKPEQVGAGMRVDRSCGGRQVLRKTGPPTGVNEQDRMLCSRLFSLVTFS